MGQDFGQTGQGPQGKPLFTHSFPVGTHRVTATGTDTAGNTASWTFTVTVYPRLVASARCRVNRRGRATFAGSAEGGRGAVLAWKWRLRRGGTARGARVAGGRARAASLTILDAAGGTATARARCR